VRSLPIGTRLIAAGDPRTTAGAVKERHVRMCVTNPTEITRTRERLYADHTDTNQRPPHSMGTNVAQKPVMGALRAVSTASTERRSQGSQPAPRAPEPTGMRVPFKSSSHTSTGMRCRDRLHR
jgi:hypothetical protein